MNAKVIRPQNELSESIDYFWSHPEDAMQLRTYCIPFLHQEVLFSFGDTFFVQQPGNPVFHYDSSGGVSGVYAAPLTTQVAGRYRAAGIMLKPQGLFALFGLDASQLNDGAVSFAKLFGEKATVIAEALQETPAGDEQLQLLVSAVNSLARPQKMPAIFTDFIRQSGEESLRKGRLQQLLRKRSFAASSFHRLCRRALGYPPQHYLRLVQLNKALRQIAEHPEFCLTEIALENGFYDQPHFVRVFRRFAGMTPSAYRKLVVDGKVHPAFPNAIIAA